MEYLSKIIIKIGKPGRALQFAINFPYYLCEKIEMPKLPVSLNYRSDSLLSSA